MKKKSRGTNVVKKLPGLKSLNTIPNYPWNRGPG